MRSRNPLIDGLACAVKKCIADGKVPYFKVEPLNRFCKEGDIFLSYNIRGAKDTASEKTIELLKALGLVKGLGIVKANFEDSPYVQVSRKIVDRFYEGIPEGEGKQFRMYGDEIVERSLCDSKGEVGTAKNRLSTAYDPNNHEHQF